MQSVKNPGELKFPQESRLELEVNEGWRRVLVTFSPFSAGMGVAQMVMSFLSKADARFPP